MAMKLTTGILAIAVMAGTAVAQNTDAIDNARSIAKSLQQKQANDTNAALDAAGVSAKPAPGAPAPAVKPATIPGSRPVTVAAPAPVKVAAKPAAAKASASANNQLQHVNIVKGSDTIAVEISSSQTVTPKLTKLDSPSRLLIELPETVVASAQNKIAVGSAGVKGVRIGMDGKNPPTTSIVVDLEKSLAYDLNPDGDKLVLTLHTGQAIANAETKNPAATVKTAGPTLVKNAAPSAAKVQTAEARPASSPKLVIAKGAPVKVAAPAPAAKTAAPATITAKTTTAAKLEPQIMPLPSADPFKGADGGKTKGDEKKPEDKKWAMSGKRDPFFSPVVQQNGSGCSTGKKCLEIGNINLRGVVKSDNGFIAVVTNNLNKAYFLRENDPVFNGYVVRITGDSVVFQETIQDKLGKPFTREVVKRIFTPAV
jgi:Tfp pilus assembly protein PilP